MARATFAVFLFSMVIYLSWGLTVDIPAPTYEFARGDNVTIPCNFKPKKPDNAAVTMEWSAHPDNPDDPDISVISVFLVKGSDPVIDVDDMYQGRASVQYDITKGVANLQLSSVTSKDTRVFTCDVKIPGDPGKADTTKVVVLVAPTKPICKIQGTAEYFQNINLTCRSEEGTPTPTYQWTSYEVTNNPRPNPPKSTDVNGVLSLYNISIVTSGYYICTSKNKIRSESCNVTLSVMPPSMNMASTAGIIGACVAAVIALVIIVCCCRRCNKKNNAEEYVMGVKKEAEYTDRDHHEIEEHQSERVESKSERSANQRDQYEDRSEQNYDHRSDRYSDRRDDYDDRRAKSDDRESDRYDDRRSDRYDDRRSDRYDDRRSDRYDDRSSDRYDDRRNDRYDDRRSDRNDDRGRSADNHNERRDQYDDRRDRYDDRRDRNDDRDRAPLKPSRA